MANFTPEELEEILQQFFNVTGKRQYIGARYVPIFGRKDEDTIIWDNSAPYEPLTIVLYQGNSYTSRTYVPEGVEITNTYFWANTGNYNAQVESYRRETAQMVAQFDELSDDVAEQIAELSENVAEQIQRIPAPINVSIQEGVDATGTNDSTIGIQTAIDNAPIGSTILFKNGAYKFSEIELKEGITYDFNNSRVICTSLNAVAIKASGSLAAQTRLSIDYNANQDYIQVRTPSGVEVGQIVYITSTDLAHEARTYYYKGFISVVTDIIGDSVYISDSVPYDISLETTDVFFYNPANNIVVKNINNVEYDGSITNSTDFLMLEFCANCTVENINVDSTIAHWIDVRHSINCQIENCHIYSPNNPYGLSLTYFIVVSSSTNTTIKNCTSNFCWHGATTGYRETALNTTVQNCVFNTIHSIYGYADHENAIGTVLNNVKSNGPITVQASNSFVTNCVASYFRVSGHSNKRLAHCQIDTCTALMNYDTTNIRQAILVQVSPQTEYRLYYAGLVVNNFVSLEPACINFDNIPIYLQVSNSRNVFWHKVGGSGDNCVVKFTNCYFKFTSAFRNGTPNVTLGSGYNDFSFIGCTFDCLECTEQQSLNPSVNRLHLADCTWLSTAASAVPVFRIELSTTNTALQINNVNYVGAFNVNKPMFVAINEISAATIFISNSRIATSGFKDNISSNILVNNSFINNGGFYSYYSNATQKLLETLPAQYNQSSTYQEVTRDF